MASTPQRQHFLLQCILVMPSKSTHHVVAQALASLGQLCLSCAQVSAGTGEPPGSSRAFSPFQRTSVPSLEFIYLLLSLK